MPRVAEIVGSDEVYGLAYERVRPMYDWSKARRSIAGRIHGVVATFALREGRMYEVYRCRGTGPRREPVTEHWWTESAELHRRTIEDVMLYVGSKCRS